MVLTARRCLLVAALAALAPFAGAGGGRQVAAVRALLRRKLRPEHAAAFTLQLLAPRSPEEQRFSVGPAPGGGVLLAGTSGVALASALNHYMKADAGAQINTWWTVQLPASLPPATPVNVTSPYRFFNYLNVCAFGYSTPFYHWARWEEEIDWMALNGVVNPLALVGQDALWLDTFVGMGLDKGRLLEEFFAGPTFQPWHWMGNLNGWGGPVDESFLRQQAALQVNITRRMVDFGMRPVLPAFAGHVPRQTAELFPGANITQLAPWHGHFPNGTFIVPPSSKLFQQIGVSFLRRQAAALGVEDSWPAPRYYLADAYNEMPPPTTNPSFLSSVSRTMYETMAAADADAVFVTQGWFLSAVPRMPWGDAQAAAFLHGPPPGKMLVLDLNAIENPVWNRTRSFYGVPFALCMLHNFGERPGLFGRLPLLASAPAAAIAGSAPGTDVGLGMTPEGTGTNSIVYDMYAERFWSGRQEPSVPEWVAGYARRRYGLPLDGTSPSDGAVTSAWALLTRSVYSAPPNIPGEQGATASEMAARPALDGGRIPDTTPTPFYNVSDVQAAWALLLQCSHAIGDAVDGYAYDVVATGRQVISDRFNQLRVVFAQAAGEAAAQAGGPWECVSIPRTDDTACATLAGAQLAECLRSTCVETPQRPTGTQTCGTCACCVRAGSVGAGPNTTDLQIAGAALLDCLDDMDALLGTHHAFLLGSPWLSDAEGWAARASTQEHGERLMRGARRIITLWGHPSSPKDAFDSHLSQYSYRLWQGLVGEFYKPRWAAFIDAVVGVVRQGRSFGPADQTAFVHNITLWEEGWVADAANSAAHFGTRPTGGTSAMAAALCRKYGIPGCTENPLGGAWPASAVGGS